MPLLKTHLKTTTIGVTNINDAARRNSQDGVSELSVTGTQFDQQSHIHHVATGVKERHTMLAGGSEQIYNPHHMMTEPSNETHHMVTGQTAQTNQFPEFLTGAFKHHANHHFIITRTCQHKCHKTTIYQWSNKHQQIKT